MTDSALIGSVGAPGLHVMTFNIRRRVPRIASHGLDRWSVRAPAVRTLLATERPHLLGMQEVLPAQDRATSAALGHDYHRIGHGREADGQGEGCPLYYDSTRLELLSWAQQALSDTPETPGSRSWGNFTARTLVQAVLRDRATGVRFRAVNTHFDHLSRRSRVHSARLVRSLVTDQPLPAIVLGDLNSGAGTSPLTELFSEGTLTDAWAATRERLTPEWGTFPNYRRPRLGRKRIDWVAVSRGITVERAAINPRRPGGVWPSDHLPVQAVVRLPEGSGR
jgi:endonuclease/exonuclease/phosphatase family metal-dependent hydrolase